MHMGEPAQIAVVGIEARCRLRLRAFDLGQLYLRGNRAGDARGDLVLQLENVVQPSFETLRPKVSARARANQLARDAYAVAGPAHAAFQQIADTELLPNLRRVHEPALVREARVAGDD